MQHDLVKRVEGYPEEPGGLLADESMRRAVKAVSADLPACRDLAVDRVGRRRRRQIVKERGVEYGDVRQIGEYPESYFDAQHRGRVVQGCQRSQFPQRFNQIGVDDCRPIKIRATVNHPVADSHQLKTCQIPPARCQHLEHRSQRGLVIGDSTVLADPFDDPVNQ